MDSSFTAQQPKESSPPLQVNTDEITNTGESSGASTQQFLPQMIQTWFPTSSVDADLQWWTKGAFAV